MYRARISSLLGKVTVLVVICFFALSAQGKYGGGTGEPNDPYLIYDANHMQAIGADVNDWDKHFKLMADIDLSEYTGTSFNIIGYYVSSSDNKPFAGVFDGNGHTISNFTYTSTGTNYIGLFRYVSGINAEIKDLGLIEPNVNAGTRNYVGSLVGCLWGETITNCYVHGGSVSGVSSVGGLVGYNRVGTITNCNSTSSVSGNEEIGGLVGLNSGTIKDSYSTGSVSGNREIGGLVGYNWKATITNCYAIGSVLGIEHDVGALVGYDREGSYTRSFWDKTVNSLLTGIGNAVNPDVIGESTANMQKESTFTNAGWDFENIWWILEGAGYPRFCWEAKYGGGSGRPNDPYLIYTAEQMNTIGACQRDWDKHFLLCADVDLSAYSGASYNIIGYYVSFIDYKPFTGVFDGNGHTISNFGYTSTGTGYIGVFGFVRGDNAEIKDLGLIDPNVDAGTGSRVGSLVGWLREATITNCYAERGIVSGHSTVGGLVGGNYFDQVIAQYGTISNCYSTASVSGNDLVGGLVGMNNYGTITNCYSTGNVTGEYVGGLVGFNNYGTITNCDSSGDVEGNSAVGGLVGWSWYISTITNCFSIGNVTGNVSVGGLVGFNYESTISNCYSTGSVVGNLRVGGLVGNNNKEGGVLNCSSTGDVNGVSYVGGLVGENEGTIANCYSTASVSGDENVGGLLGCNYYWHSTITNCYSTSSVVGNLRVGGLVGWNRDNSKITNSYSTGSVKGAEDVGGLVGMSYRDYINDSFWDIGTSGQDWSDGGTGKTTAEMQTMSTFTDAGWDFVGEIVNGTEDIWFIPQGDYPHLWWEGMQVPMKLTPRKLNCRSQGNWVKAHLTLPQGVSVADVDPDRPAVLLSFGFESAPLYVFVNKDKLVEIEAAFEREAVCSLAGEWPQALTVAGFMADGNIFLGTSTVRIIHPVMKVIEELAWYWLNADCVQPDFCNQIDMNRDSVVNLADYALLMNIEVEFVTDE